MENTREFTENMKEYVRRMLSELQIEQEKKPLRFVQQFGYLTYIRLFVESQKNESLQEYFPYAGFPMEWTRGDEPMEGQQRIWQLQYQMQYCGSIVEEGHFMEQAKIVENAVWMEALCQFIDWLSGHCRWGEGMPSCYGAAMEEMIRQMDEMGNTDIFLMPEPLTGLLVQLGTICLGENSTSNKNIRIWNPACRTGEFLAALHRNCENWNLTGTEGNKDQAVIAQMLQFYQGVQEGIIQMRDPLEESVDSTYHLVVSNPPVGELAASLQERFPIVTRKIQLQYLQMILQSLEEDGLGIVVINEGTLFKFEAEMKVRQSIMENCRLHGVISLPAGAFMPYTMSKMSILIFEKRKVDTADQMVFFYEIENPGYTMDRKRELREESQIPELLQCWKERKNLEEQWKISLQSGEQRNQWENPVPQVWEQEHCWFADRATIRKNDYNFTVGRYKPWSEEMKKEEESPLQMLRQLEAMEQETLKQMRELIEMVENYG